MPKYVYVVVLVLFFGFCVFQYGFDYGIANALLDTRDRMVGIDSITKTTMIPTTTSEPMGEICFTEYRKQVEEKKKNVAGSLPWLDLATVKLFCESLSSHQSVLEWGCGGSTIFFSRFVKKWTCVEHVPSWGQFINKALKNESFSDKVSVNVIEPSSFYDAKIPAGSKNDGTYEQFREYIEFPASLGETFDVILDDGRARVAAAESAIRNKLLKEDGILIIHDWERRSYKVLLERGFYEYKVDKESRRHLGVLKLKDKL